MLCKAMLRHAMLRYARLCYAMLYCAMLRYATLCLRCGCLPSGERKHLIGVAPGSLLGELLWGILKRVMHAACLAKENASSEAGIFQLSISCSLSPRCGLCMARLSLISWSRPKLDSAGFANVLLELANVRCRYSVVGFPWLCSQYFTREG